VRDKKCDPLRFVNSGERKLTGQKGLEEGVRRRRKSRRRINSSPGEMQPRPSSILILARVLLSAGPSALDDEINLHYPVRKQFWSSGGGEGGEEKEKADAESVSSLTSNTNGMSLLWMGNLGSV